ncbi:uncharacterized protein BP5553_04240 [Venustampulla echinocandica]|uniref:Deacetylase sirtuin-type domain-containing protein n=1 Tax=Venustampulla echinocandica TaxID=2656787 RepID=A0A370TWJ5_9HELO|nr:uncharacterized protein BP5553_04240 [Venustampulla echinocandica]RDL39900.1 hypothetical protein BP5553_04240 [Venustampulla echinocandica]
MPTINVKPGSNQELQLIADALGKSRKVVVVTGAGISTNCGIPDFRSEDGLYSLIQAQYDAALQNPPWANSNTFNIDDRPKKRVKPSYFFEVVAPDGNVVGVVDEQRSTPQRPRRRQQEPRISPRSPSTSPLSSRSVTPTVDFLDSTSSSRRPSLQIETSTGSTSNESYFSSTDPDSSQTCSYVSERQLDSIHVEILPSTADLNQRPQRVLCEPQQSFEFNSDIKSSNTLARAPITTPLSNNQLPSTADSIRPQPVPTSSTNPSIGSLSSTPELLPSIRQSLQTEDSGLSSKSESRALPNLKGRDLFDSMIWSDPFTTSIFYMFISSLRQKIRNQVTSTTDTHQFIKALRDGGRLVRNYTQNIDCLEERLGLSTDISRGPGNRSRFHSKMQREARPTEVSGDSPHNGGVEIVLLHGGLGALRCGICGQRTSWDEDGREATTLSGQAPDCPSCAEYNARRTGRGRRGLAIGRLRPDIVLYGEEHPNANLVGPLITHDLGLGPDLLLIMGTSLRVHGLKVMIKEFAKAIRTKGGKVVFVNRTKPAESTWGDIIDYWVEWDCDAWVRDVKDRRPEVWLPQGTVEDWKRKEPSSDTKPVTKKAHSDCKPPSKRPSRPQATRDDKMNGVYVTFKILDTLGKFVDPEGRSADRLPYFEKATPRTSTTSITKPVAGKKVIAPKRRTKSLSSSKPQTTKANLSKKRKSCPGGEVNDEGGSNELSARVMEGWEKLRGMAPTLSAEAPSREALSNLSLNLLRESKFMFSATFNHFPNLGGICPLNQMNLVTHPPFGSTLPLHRSPKKGSLHRRHTVHAYGTRASKVSSSADTIAFDKDSPPKHTIWLSEEDTIVVKTQEPGDGIKESLPTPPGSGPFTPTSQRIKRMGSIGAILSSPEDEVEVWHDASEILT